MDTAPPGNLLRVPVGAALGLVLVIDLQGADVWQSVGRERRRAAVVLPVAAAVEDERETLTVHVEVKDLGIVSERPGGLWGGSIEAVIVADAVVLVELVVRLELP